MMTPLPWRPNRAGHEESRSFRCSRAASIAVAEEMRLDDDGMLECPYASSVMSAFNNQPLRCSLRPNLVWRLTSEVLQRG